MVYNARVVWDLPSTIDDMVTYIRNPSNWSTQDGTGNQDNDGTIPDFPGDLPSFSGTLPVELEYFKAALLNNMVALSWSTATELNNHYFQIERSADSRTFETIGKVEGAGTSYETLYYTFKDEQPLAGWNYYRLKQVDFDGQFDYSPVRAVLMGQTAETNERLEFFPNPAGDEIFIQSPTRVVSGDQVEIYDQFGRLVLQVHLAETQDAPIRLSTLPAGVYVARLQTAEGFAVGKFLVKR